MPAGAGTEESIMTEKSRNILFIAFIGGVALALSGCQCCLKKEVETLCDQGICGLCDKDIVYYFNVPGNNDCPDNYIYIADTETDGLDDHTGGGGVRDREGRGGVKDRQGEFVTAACLKDCPPTKCLNSVTPMMNPIESHELGLLVVEGECINGSRDPNALTPVCQ